MKYSISPLQTSQSKTQRRFRMCTVTFVPQTDGFIFTSNRDEDPSRAAIAFQEKQIGRSKVFFPEDQQAKGSWFAFSDTGQFACVLNGAFQPHDRKTNYLMSRGLMLLQFFEPNSINEFLRSFSFEGIEPFTLLIYNADDFREVRWDEDQLHQKQLSMEQVHLWSSCTLYNEDWWKQRSTNFGRFIKEECPDQSMIINYHKLKLPFEVAALQARLQNYSPIFNIPIETTSVSSLKKTKAGFSFLFSRTDGSLKIQKSTFS